MATPNPLAVEAIKAKTPVGSPLNSEGWGGKFNPETGLWEGGVPQALREPAQFSSKDESFRLLQRIQDRLTTAIENLRPAVMGSDGGEGAYQRREKFVGEV